MPRPIDPITVTLCDEGAEYFEAWAARWLSVARKDIASDEASSVGYASAFGSKLRGMALRLILSLHCLENPRPEEVAPSLETVRCVLDVLVPFCKAHVERLSSVIRDDPAIRMAERVLAWAGERASFSRTQAFNGIRTGLSSVDDLNPALSVLVDAGWLKPIGKVTTRSKGSEPAARRYDCHPAAAECLASFRASEPRS